MLIRAQEPPYEHARASAASGFFQIPIMLKFASELFMRRFLFVARGGLTGCVGTAARKAWP